MPSLRPKSLCACLALVVTTSVVAYLPPPPSTGYSVEAGDHVFVMLTTGCVDEWAEIIVTPPVLAALRAGIKTVMLPKRNEKDLEDVPASVREKLEFVWLENVEDAVRCAMDINAKELVGN